MLEKRSQHLFHIYVFVVVSKPPCQAVWGKPETTMDNLDATATIGTFVVCYRGLLWCVNGCWCYLKACGRILQQTPDAGYLENTKTVTSRPSVTHLTQQVHKYDFGYRRRILLRTGQGRDGWVGVGGGGGVGVGG